MPLCPFYCQSRLHLHFFLFLPLTRCSRLTLLFRLWFTLNTVSLHLSVSLSLFLTFAPVFVLSQFYLLLLLLFLLLLPSLFFFFCLNLYLSIELLLLPSIPLLTHFNTPFSYQLSHLCSPHHDSSVSHSLIVLPFLYISLPLCYLCAVVPRPGNSQQSVSFHLSYHITWYFPLNVPPLPACLALITSLLSPLCLSPLAFPTLSRPPTFPCSQQPLSTL